MMRIRLWLMWLAVRPDPRRELEQFVSRHVAAALERTDRQQDLRELEQLIVAAMASRN